MSLPELPPLSPEKYRWHESSTNPRTLQRLANGTEAWVGIEHENAKGQYDNYLNTTVFVHTPSSSLTDLKEEFAAALVPVRFRHPEVACTALWTEQRGPPYIQYTPPESNNSALEWARTVVSMRAIAGNGLDLRTLLEKERREQASISGPKAAQSLAITLTANVKDSDEPLPPGTRLDILMHFNHIYWDGISGRAFVGDLLRCFGDVWVHDKTHPMLPEFNWGNEISNLSVPILDACKIDVGALHDDLEFSKAREEFIQSLINSGSSWGLTVNNEVGVPRTQFLTFTAEESDAIIQAVKQRIGSEYTITHLGHAATVYALLEAKPLPADIPDSQALIMPLPVNGRRFVKDANAQYGACQAGAVVEFPHLKSWESNESNIKASLASACNHIKKSYDYWLNKNFQLALGVSKDNFLSDFLSSSPMPFTGSSIPIFVSDGVVDNYVPHEVATPAGEKLLTVENCAFLLDTYLPDILIRMDSWKRATSLSLCYNDGYFSTIDAQAFLQRIANFMLTFAS